MRFARFIARHAAVVAGVGLAVVAAAPAAAAANKEHQQMLAEIRMLQEQNAQLQQTIGSLIDTLKVVNTKLDEQSASGRKVAADSKLQIDGLSGELRIVREKIDDTHVRLGTLAQEVDSLRNSIPQQPPPGTYVDPSAPGATGAPATSPGVTPTTPVPGSTTGATTPATSPVMTPAPAPNPAAGMSPQRLWDMAYSDYASGQWPLAIQGFETYLRTFPRSSQADDAQFYIGEAYQLDGKMREAVSAYNRVISDFPQSDKAAEAYYKLGLTYGTLNQPDKAKESFEAVIKLFPNSESSRLARQRLDSQGRRD